jgi:membrane protein DedA with SNARE-associated domain
MRWPRFVAFNATGAALWVAVWTTVGYLSGNRIDTVYDDAGRYEAYLAIAVTALVIAYVVRRMRRNRAARAESTA